MYLRGEIGVIFSAIEMINADDPPQLTEPKPIIYACSGCSDAGELADRVARELTKQGVAQMSCLAGIGGRVKSLMLKGQKAERIVVVDGCPLNCGRHTLLNAGFENFEHVGLHELGHRKGACPVTDERVAAASTAVADLIKQADEKNVSTIKI